MTAEDNQNATTPSSSSKAGVYVAAALIMGFLLFVGIGVLSADGSCDASSPLSTKASAYQGIGSLRCKYKPR